MRKLAIIIAAAALTLTACSKDANNSSAPQASVNGSDSASSAPQSVTESTPQSTAESAPQSMAESTPQSTAESAPQSAPKPAGELAEGDEDYVDPHPYYTFNDSNYNTGTTKIVSCENKSGKVKLPNAINDNQLYITEIEGTPGKPSFPYAREITLPERLEEIDEYAFAGSVKLKEITLPSTVTEIGEHAFDGCTALEKITLNDGLRAIDENAFAGCLSLTEINIPSSVIDIEENAFDTMTAFTVKYNGTEYTPETIALLYAKLDD